MGRAVAPSRAIIARYAVVVKGRKEPFTCVLDPESAQANFRHLARKGLAVRILDYKNPEQPEIIQESGDWGEGDDADNEAAAS